MIPTYNKCVQLCKDNIAFIYKEVNINNHKVVLFNYRLAQPKDFYSTNFATEMRGICFVFKSDGSLFSHYVGMQKFWNVNEVESTLYDNIKDKKVKAIYEKLDGSNISFVRFPDNVLLPKTQKSFDNEQTDLTNQFLKLNPNYVSFVNELFDLGLYPFFELTSRKNQVVVEYMDTKLTLLHVRNNSTGQYIDLSSIGNLIVKYSINYVKPLNITLSEIIELQQTKTKFEGWVSKMENDQFVKWKTKWYFENHKILTEYVNHENYLIEMILTDKIDDLKSKNLSKELIAFIETVEVKIRKYLTDKINILNSIDYSKSQKELASFYNKDVDFHLIMKGYNNKDFDSIIREAILKQTNKLEKAREFLNKI